MIITKTKNKRKNRTPTITKTKNQRKRLLIPVRGKVDDPHIKAADLVIVGGQRQPAGAADVTFMHRHHACGFSASILNLILLEEPLLP